MSVLAGKTLDLLKRIHKALGESTEAWALIGGAALPLRGRIRGTRDLDVLVLAADPARLVQALVEAGLAHHPRADRHRLERVQLLRFWYPLSQAASLGVDVQVAMDPYLVEVARRATPVAVSELAVPWPRLRTWSC